jgi:hypothetical protein
VCSDEIETNVFINTSVLGCFYTLAFVILAVVVKFVPRQRVLSFNLLMSCVAGFLLVNVHEPILILIAYFATVIFAGINVSVINSVACDAIPTNYRRVSCIYD